MDTIIRVHSNSHKIYDVHSNGHHNTCAGLQNTCA